LTRWRWCRKSRNQWAGVTGLHRAACRCRACANAATRTFMAQAPSWASSNTPIGPAAARADNRCRPGASAPSRPATKLHSWPEEPLRSPVASQGGITKRYACPGQRRRFGQRPARVASPGLSPASRSCDQLLAQVRMILTMFLGSNRTHGRACWVVRQGQRNAPVPAGKIGGAAPSRSWSCPFGTVGRAMARNSAALELLVAGRAPSGGPRQWQDRPSRHGAP